MSLPIKHPSFPARLLSAGLATIIALTPIAPIVAQDRESPTPAGTHELSDEGQRLVEVGGAREELEQSTVERLGASGVSTVPPETIGDPDEVTPISLPGAEARSAVTPQAISLPGAEGSVQGMGESFAPVLSSGTATFSVPIAVAPGRAGVQPSLGLSYASSAGNGPVGFGWGLGAPFISRQTDRGLPRYVDQPGWHAEEDRFIYNGGQELVPVGNAAIAAVDQRAVVGETANASELPDGVTAEWQQYRARVEGAFMRFFRSGDSQRWVVQSRDGTRYDFGVLDATESPAEIAAAAPFSLERDPEPRPGTPRVFRWGLTRMSDAHGSAVYYRYIRDGEQSYLSEIYYLSPSSCAASTPELTRDCTASVSEYGARVALGYERRQDVFSSYTSGWRIDTAFRLATITVSAWDDSLGARGRVRRYHLGYDPSSFHSLLASVQVEGRPETPVANLGVSVGQIVPEGSLVAGVRLPAMRLGYSTMPIGGDQVPGFGGVDGMVRRVVGSPPHSVDEANADLFDVNSDGLPDLVVTDPSRYGTPSGGPAAGVFFNGFVGRSAQPSGDPTTVHFSDAVATPMHGADGTLPLLSNVNIVPMDVDGDGRSDLLHMPRERRYGWFTPTRDADPQNGPAPVSPAVQGWRWTHRRVDLPEGFFDPRIDLARDSAHIETVDVNNDHLIDVVRTTGTVTQTWLNLGWLPDGEGRFGSARWDGTDWVLSIAPIESCLLESGRPVDFDSAEIRLADLNADGLLDIAEVRRGRVRYWPGRGPGIWGEGGRDCARGQGAGRYIDMQDPPVDLDVDLTGVSFMDVNEDGASDLVQIRFDAVDVWFNRAGGGWTRRLTARGTPPTTTLVDRTRIVDIDGSGTTDVVWANAADWRYVDLAGGHRPRLLVRVENGLGAVTTIDYESSAVDYTRDLADAATCSACDRFTWSHVEAAPDGVAEGQYRSGGSPVISTVVRRVRASDQMSLVGREDQVGETRFKYHDGYYEGIEQEFRGFGAADIESVGDWNSPTSSTRTFFHQGRRPSPIADVRLADNPYEPLKGREYLTETFNESGVYLSSAHATIAVRPLVQGLDGRWVRSAFVSETNELRYDTTVWAPGAEEIYVDDIRYERWASGSWSADPGLSATQRTMAARGGNVARIRTTYDDVDTLGQVRRQTAHGHVTLAGFDSDPLIVSVMDPRLVSGSRWIWRTQRTYVTGADGVPLHDTTVSHSSVGDSVASTQDVQSGATYDFSGEANSEGGALDPDLAAPAVPDLIGSTRVDVWGQAFAVCAGSDISGLAASVPATSLPSGCLRYGRVTRDALFDQVVTSETAHVAETGVATLSSQGTWDRGLGTVTSVTDPNSLTSSAAYDGLGRVVAIVPPNVESCSGTHPSTRVTYELTSDSSTIPLSRVIARAETNCDGILGESGGVVETISYIDGHGRARATLATGDSSGQWIRGGLNTLDKKGTVRRSYQPDVYTGSSTDLSAVLALPVGSCPFASGEIPYTVARYDAFGRPVGGHAEDCSYTTASYHSLSADVCDPLDNEPGGERTCMTIRNDGHQRIVDQILRLEDPDTQTNAERYRLWAYYRADGALLSVVRAQTVDEDVRPAAPPNTAAFRFVRRDMYYDSVGRRLGTNDRDTNSRSASADRFTWRYLFNRVGDVAAVRDPRGCGQNFFYDLGGRLLGEQYVSCNEAQASASELPIEVLPSGSVGIDRYSSSAIAVDVRYVYDANPTFVSVPSHGGGAYGRATAVIDRGQRSAVAYDARGNAVWTARQMALIADASALAGGTVGGRPSWAEQPQTSRVVTYDTDHTYVRTARFDHAGRGVALVLPDDELWGGTSSAPTIGGTITYNRRGLPLRADVTVGCNVVANPAACPNEHVDRFPVSREVLYTPDGLPYRITWGDDVDGRDATVSTTSYDVRRRPVMTETFREANLTESLGTLPRVSEVVHQQLTWDAVSNLTEIADLRPGAEWPLGARPQHVSLGRDALYRVESVGFWYTDALDQPTTYDDSTDWRSVQASIRSASADPMDVEPAPMVPSPPDARGETIEWSWDFLGNATSCIDDASSFYERSLGVIGNGVDSTTQDLRPSALYVATNIPTTGISSMPSGSSPGWVQVDYGDGGNVVAMTVHGQCTNAPAFTCGDLASTDPSARTAQLATRCACAVEQHYQYRWDELNRLGEARRWDRASGGSWLLQVRQRYRYDGANVRTIKQTTEPSAETITVGPGEAQERIALYVSAGDHEIRGLARDPWSDTYVPRAAGHVETQYLIAGARLIWRHETDGAAMHRRLTVPLSDVVQTTAATLDLLTGDLVEVSTYYPNGARETLLASTDDPSAVEPAGFTGKEADEEVGLTYFGERYLIARLGRWASADPLETHALAGGDPLNSYHYIRGNLHQGRDPLGLNDNLCGEGCTATGPREYQLPPIVISGARSLGDPTGGGTPPPTAPASGASALGWPTGAPDPHISRPHLGGTTYSRRPTSDELADSIDYVIGGGIIAAGAIAVIAAVGLAVAGAGLVADVGAGATVFSGSEVAGAAALGNPTLQAAGTFVTEMALGEIGMTTGGVGGAAAVADELAGGGGRRAVASVVDDVVDDIARGVDDIADDAARAGARGLGSPTAACPGGRCPCFVAGTLVDTAVGQRPIEEIQLGDRVGPESALCESVTFEGWREIHLTMTVESGRRLDEIAIRLVRSSDWVAEVGVIEGGTVHLVLEDMNVAGGGRVTYLGPAPELAPGRRCPVTGTVTHVSDDIIGLVIGTTGDLLEVTRHHPLYSADRDGWVAAGEVRPREVLETRGGHVAVRSTLPQAQGPRAVFNLEVFHEHEYFVGRDRVRVHNTYGAAVMARIRQLAASLPDAGQLYRCAEFAESLREGLRALGIRGQFLAFRAGASDNMVSDFFRGGAETITTNGWHYAIRVGDTVFDNFVPNGVPVDQYMRALHALGGVHPQAPVPF